MTTDMMKVYITPKMRIINISTTCLLAQSTTPDGFSFGAANKPSAVKRKNIWDDAEEW